ncbi:hypothetical protein FRB91_001761 [Serendipita sp. 411]|nr:hypothetical protein FRC15_011325 [Serendipita sp. 397]KAG8784306.1 hypothetical protein FRC16_002188 [Serendipita sp. 398]KAG8813653.1 hypothetical protein FRC19_002288 [Serendipita sp. 401]KAG8845427.1 hypothetical protein FRB91_001761 [Serendipita sp. 411]KAG8848902.1 hypothetical protein FRC20_002427 [Serendipita sp. 405]KAG9043934.1 hypothetical protein FS842_001628 [Serendipita sp. 407]
MSYPQRPTSGPSQQELESRKQQLSDISKEIQSTARDIGSHLATVEVYQTLLEIVKATEGIIANQLNQDPEGCTELLRKQSEGSLPPSNEIIEPVALASWSEWVSWSKGTSTSVSSELGSVERLQSEINDKAILFQTRLESTNARLSAACQLLLEQTTSFSTLASNLQSIDTESPYNSASSPSNPSSAPFVVRHQDQQVGFERPESLESLVQQVRERFSIAPDQSLIVGKFNLGPYLSPSDGISPLAWPYIYPPLKLVHVCPPQPPFDKTAPYRIYIKTLTGKAYTLEVTWNEAIISMKEKLETQSGIPSMSLRVIYKGVEIENDKTMKYYNVNPEATMHLILSLRKPIIYLFSETNLIVEVSLLLSPMLSFTGVYPVSPIKTSDSGEEMIRWNVETRKDGTLLDLGTGLEVAYIYWKASAVSPLSPPSSRPVTPINADHDPGVEVLDPMGLAIDPKNSVLVSLAMLPTYLDTTMRTLGLHTEARTSFITYWLPNMHRYSHIALRFLSQAAYEKSAPLNIIPQPTEMMRVIMVWKGVKETDAFEGGPWKDAMNRFQKMPVGEWKQIVGVSGTNLRECGEGLRVLEWGGMQVF